MDIQAYISSGIIESYLLGLAAEEEVQELHALRARYPEVKEAMDAYAGTLDKYARLYTVAPPEGLKEKIWNSLQHPGKIAGNEDKPPAMVIHPVMKYIVAASILLVVVSLLLNLVFFNKYRTYKDKYSHVSLEQNKLLAQSQAYQAGMEQYRQALHVMTDTSMKAVMMTGVPVHPGMKAVVYWNKRSGDLYLKVDNLPAPPSGMQYELWAVIDGRMVSAGMYNAGNAAVLQKMKAIAADAQAFAITLEKEGGGGAPTLSAMYVKGEV